MSRNDHTINHDENGFYVEIQVPQRGGCWFTRIEYFQSRPTNAVINIRRRRYDSSCAKAERVINRLCRGKRLSRLELAELAWPVVDKLVHPSHKHRVFSDICPKEALYKTAGKPGLICTENYNFPLHSWMMEPDAGAVFSPLDHNCEWCGALGGERSIRYVSVPSSREKPKGRHTKNHLDYAGVCKRCRTKAKRLNKEFDKYIETRNILTQLAQGVRECQKSQIAVN